MQAHISPVFRTCFYRLRSIRRCLDREVAARLVSTKLIFSPLDYCNAILANLQAIPFAPQQRVLNAEPVLL